MSNSQIPIYLEDIKELIEEKLHFFDVREVDQNAVEKSIRLIKSLIKNSFLNAIDMSGIWALDAFGKEFRVRKNDYKYILNDLDLIYKTKLQYPDIEFSEILLKSNRRYSVIYNGLGGRFKKDSANIVDIPVDIFKFLIENKYDKAIIIALIDNDFKLAYNFVEAFRKLLQIGTTFSTKSRVLSDTEMNIIKYIGEEYNPVSEYKLNKLFSQEYGDKKYGIMAKYCNELNINLRTMAYRVGWLNMSTDDAIDIGLLEYERYGIGYTTNIQSENHFNEKDVFYAVAREYIKEREQEA